MVAISDGADVDVESAYEELQIDYDEKCDDVAQLKAELKAKRIEAQQLRLRLQAAGVKNTSLIKGELKSSKDTGATRAAELCRLLQWLAEHVDFNCPLYFDACCEISVGGRRVFFRHITQWRLKVPGKLKVSVPAELEMAIGNLLLAVRARGGDVDEEMARAFNDTWEFVANEAAPLAGAQVEPALILAHRETSAGILVATWPTVEVKRYILDDAFCDDADGVHFRLSMNMEDRAQPDWFLRWGFTVDAIPCGAGWVKVGRCFLPMEIEGRQVLREVEPEIDPGAARRIVVEGVGGIHGQPPAFGALPPPCHVAVGDRVEVECKGKWLAGVLCAIEGSLASVQCDVQLPGVQTSAPVSSVRKIPPDQDYVGYGLARPRTSSGHKRAKSAM